MPLCLLLSLPLASPASLAPSPLPSLTLTAPLPLLRSPPPRMASVKGTTILGTAALGGMFGLQAFHTTESVVLFSLLLSFSSTLDGQIGDATRAIGGVVSAPFEQPPPEVAASSEEEPLHAESQASSPPWVTDASGEAQPSLPLELTGKGVTIAGLFASLVAAVLYAGVQGGVIDLQSTSIDLAPLEATIRHSSSTTPSDSRLADKLATSKLADDLPAPSPAPAPKPSRTPDPKSSSMPSPSVPPSKSSSVPPSKSSSSPSPEPSFAPAPEPPPTQPLMKGLASSSSDRTFDPSTLIPSDWKGGSLLLLPALVTLAALLKKEDSESQAISPSNSVSTPLAPPPPSTPSAPIATFEDTQPTPEAASTPRRSRSRQTTNDPFDLRPQASTWPRSMRRPRRASPPPSPPPKSEDPKNDPFDLRSQASTLPDTSSSSGEMDEVDRLQGPATRKSGRDVAGRRRLLKGSLTLALLSLLVFVATRPITLALASSCSSATSRAAQSLASAAAAAGHTLSQLPNTVVGYLQAMGGSCNSVVSSIGEQARAVTLLAWSLLKYAATSLSLWAQAVLPFAWNQVDSLVSAILWNLQRVGGACGSMFSSAGRYVLLGIALLKYMAASAFLEGVNLLSTILEKVEVLPSALVQSSQAVATSFAGMAAEFLRSVASAASGGATLAGAALSASTAWAASFLGALVSAPATAVASITAGVKYVGSLAMMAIIAVREAAINLMLYIAAFVGDAGQKLVPLVMSAKNVAGKLMFTVHARLHIV